LSIPGPYDRPLVAGIARVVITGSECTGKTTLSQSLAERVGALWIPEYARAYAESVARPLAEADVALIARGQIAIEDAHLVTTPSLVVQDTDLISTVVYARHYYGACPEWIVDAAHNRLASLYLISDIDIPWVGDSVRDRPLERELVDSLFRKTLTDLGASVCLLSGLGANRLHNALKLIGDWSSRRP
jgi:nicotinamide riboside kinase